MSDDSITVRPATPDDAQVLRDIYAPYVEGTPVTLECTVPSVEEFAGRISRILPSYPYLVAQLEGQAVGYAYAAPFRPRAAYIWSVETSIYVRQDLRRKGIGVRLYSCLESILRRQNINCICACVTFPNKDSIHFHSRMGFKKVAQFERCAYKLGQWRDIVWMEKSLISSDAPPEPFIPFPKLGLGPDSVL